MLEARMARDGGFGHGGSPPGVNTPSPQGFGPPGGVPPLGGPMIPGSGSDVDTRLPLALSIASTVLCCNPILGASGDRPRDPGAQRRERRIDRSGAEASARGVFVLSLAAMGLGLSFEVFEAIRYLAAAH